MSSKTNKKKKKPSGITPKKIKGTNRGRKRVDLTNASRRTRHRRAEELLEFVKYDLDVLKEMVMESVKNSDLDLLRLAIKIGKMLLLLTVIFAYFVKRLKENEIKVISLLN